MSVRASVRLVDWAPGAEQTSALQGNALRYIYIVGLSSVKVQTRPGKKDKKLRGLRYSVCESVDRLLLLRARTACERRVNVYATSLQIPGEHLSRSEEEGRPHRYLLFPPPSPFRVLCPLAIYYGRFPAPPVLERRAMRYRGLAIYSTRRKRNHDASC